MAKARKSKKSDDWFRPLELVETDDLVAELLSRHKAGFIILHTGRSSNGENDAPTKARITGDPLSVFRMTTMGLKWYVSEIPEEDRTRINNYITFGRGE